MSREPGFLAHDPASAQAVARVLLVGGFAGAWCTLVHLLTGRPVDPAPILVAAAIVAAGHAVARRERPVAPSLNRWDEALAFLGLAALATGVGRAMAGG